MAKNISDWELLHILYENNYLDLDTQDDYLAETDVDELYSTVNEVRNILLRKKNKKSWRENFLSEEDELILKSFLAKLNQQVQELHNWFSEAIHEVLHF